MDKNKKEQSKEFQDFLNSTGLAKYCIREGDFDLSLWHDLKIYGDVAESYMEVLNELYDVDISEFDFYLYFPAEFLGETTFQRCLATFFPFMRAWYHSKRTYKRLMFKDIKRAIETRKLL